MTVDKDLLEAARWLRGTRDPTVQQAIASTLRFRECASLVEMAKLHPDALMELHDAMQDLVGQIPLKDVVL